MAIDIYCVVVRSVRKLGFGTPCSQHKNLPDVVIPLSHRMMRNKGLPAKVDFQNHRIAILALGEEKQCLFLIESRRKSTNVRRRPRSPALPGNVCAEILSTSASTMRSWGTITA
jgi:hypothetical protein